MQTLFCVYIVLGFLNSIISTQATGFYYTGSGGLRNMCPIACYEGYFLSGGSCLPKTYVVQFQVAVMLPADSTFNVRKYIASMASLAGISGCAYTPTTVTANRVYESACTTPTSVIRATVDTLNTVVTSSFSLDRRLLAAATADVVTEIRIQSDSTKATAVQQSITVSTVNTQLTDDEVGTTTTVSTATVQVQAIVPASTPVRSTSRGPSSSSSSSSSRSSTAAQSVITTAAQSKITTAARPASTAAPSVTTAAPPAPPPSPDTTPAPASSSSNLGIIIGASAIGVLVLAGGGVSVVLCCSVKKGGTPKNTTSPPARKQASTKQIRMAYLSPNASLEYTAPRQLLMEYPLQHIHIHRFQ